jgi:hypothetical protein
MNAVCLPCLVHFSDPFLTSHATDCGNQLEHNSRSIPCGQHPTSMPCKGNSAERCGGPNLLDVYALPGSGLSPLIPYDPMFNGF